MTTSLRRHVLDPPPFNPWKVACNNYKGLAENTYNICTAVGPCLKFCPLPRHVLPIIRGDLFSCHVRSWPGTKSVHFPFIEIMWQHKESWSCGDWIKFFWLGADADSLFYGKISHHMVQLKVLAVWPCLYPVEMSCISLIVRLWFPLTYIYDVKGGAIRKREGRSDSFFPSIANKDLTTWLSQRLATLPVFYHLLRLDPILKSCHEILEADQIKHPKQVWTACKSCILLKCAALLTGSQWSGLFGVFLDLKLRCFYRFLFSVGLRPLGSWIRKSYWYLLLYWLMWERSIVPWSSPVQNPLNTSEFFIGGQIFCSCLLFQLLMDPTFLKLFSTVTIQ